VKGYRNSTTAIHKLLTMELLFRQFFDSQPNDTMNAPEVDAMAKAI